MPLKENGISLLFFLLGVSPQLTSVNARCLLTALHSEPRAPGQHRGCDARTEQGRVRARKGGPRQGAPQSPQGLSQRLKITGSEVGTSDADTKGPTRLRHGHC